MDEVQASARREASLNLVAWRDVAAWLDYAALEFSRDAATSEHLQHVSVCVRDEGERRYARQAGFEPALAAV